jgi:hypothetical protein
VKERAYVVALIKRGTPSIVEGAGVFGEPCPTTMGGVIPIEVYHCEADTFEKANKAAQLALEDSSFDWCGQVMRDGTRGIYRLAWRIP